MLQDRPSRPSAFRLGDYVSQRPVMHGEGCTCVGNVLWFLLAGLWLAIGHCMVAIVYFVSIIGIPFAYEHVKIASLAVCPFGATVGPRAYSTTKETYFHYGATGEERV